MDPNRSAARTIAPLDMQDISSREVPAIRWNFPAPRAAAYSLMLAAMSGCVTSQVVLVGPARPAISPDQVQIYLQPPESKYVQIANLTASSGGSFAITPAAKMDKVIKRLKTQAAKLGANGILLYGVGNRSAGSVGAGISTETNSPHSPYGLGFGASAFFFQKLGDGVAIYVDPK